MSLSRGQSPTVVVTGKKNAVKKARRDVMKRLQTQAKLVSECLLVEKIYHPFVCGPHNAIIKQLMEETGARINVPTLRVQKDEITVSGEKDSLNRCKATIMSIYQEKKRKCQTVSAEVRKSQHKYVIGPRGSNLQEILANTGVSVEVPLLDSPSETITLRGEQEKLGLALTMVYSKANSVIYAAVNAPEWLHKFIIGKKGENIRRITQKCPKVHFEFLEGQDKIQVVSPPEEVEQAVAALQDYVKDLESRMDFVEIEIEQQFHKYVIGKAGANIKKIKNETDVMILIPPDAENSPIIRIEGDPKGVERAKQQLMEMASRMENEKTKDVIIYQRFHKNIIGPKGKTIRGIIDQFNQVHITFPDQGKRSNIVTLRGPKNDVDKCAVYLDKMAKDLVVSSYQAQVHIFKAFHKNIIGKNGTAIRQIGEETETRIDLPSENSNSVITITGKKTNVEAAKVIIKKIIEKELGHSICSIMDKCGGVINCFPAEGNTSDKVLIGGPQYDVENARKQLLEVTNLKSINETSKRCILIGEVSDKSDFRPCDSWTFVKRFFKNTEVGQYKKDPRSYACNVCDKRLSTKSGMEQHKNYHKDFRPCENWIYVKRFSKKTKVVRYERHHMNFGHRECDFCGQRLSTKRKPRQQTDFRPDKSRVFAERFTNNTEVAEYRRPCKGFTLYEMGGCEEIFSKMGEVGLYKSHQCEVCAKRFSKTSELEQHKRHHNEFIRNQCDICGKGFSTLKGMEQHKRHHTDFRPFQCDICDKRFSTKSERNEHRRHHKG